MKRLTLLKDEGRWLADDIERDWVYTRQITKQDRKRLVQIYAQWPGLRPSSTLLDKEAPNSGA